MKMNRTQMILLLLAVTVVIFPLLLMDKSFVSADEALFLKINDYWNPTFDSFFRILTELGSFTFWFVVIFVLWVCGRRTLATYLLVAIAIHIALGGSMKYIIDRPRPFDVFSDTFAIYNPSDPSFPSGHTEGSFAAAAVLGMRNKTLLFPLILLAIFVGLSRVYIGVHFPFDVVSGAVFGTLIGVFVAGLDLSRLQERMESGWKRILRPFRFERKG